MPQGRKIITFLFDWIGEKVSEFSDGAPNFEYISRGQSSINVNALFWANLRNQNCDSGMARDKIMVIGFLYKQCIFMVSF